MRRIGNDHQPFLLFAYDIREIKNKIIIKGSILPRFLATPPSVLTALIYTLLTVISNSLLSLFMGIYQCSYMPGIAVIAVEDQSCRKHCLCLRGLLPQV